MAKPSRGVIGYCRGAFDFTPLCPTLLPKAPAALVETLRCGDCPGIFQVEEIFFAAPTYRGLPQPEWRPGAGHVVVFEGVGQRLLDARRCRRLGDRGVRVRGRSASWYLCPPRADTVNQGHLVLEWRSSGITYDVSAHSEDGYTAANRALILAIASHLRPA